MRHTPILLVTLALIAVATTARADHAESHHWHRTAGDLEVDIVLIDSLTPKWSKPFRRAIAKWNESPYVNFTIEKGSDSKATRQACDSTGTTKIRVCNGAYPEDSWAGLTSPFRDGSNHLVTARIRFNTLQIGPNRHVVCHELGHLIGVAHRDYLTSCMKQGATDAKVPDAHDFEQIEVIYDHSH